MERNTPTIAILSSGGDSQGMNAAIRGAVRCALDRGAIIYGVCEGYDGLVQGGDKVRRMSWDDVGGILAKGGTMLGSARSAAFRTREGRIQAAQTLIKLGVDSLIVIGGDGSLTGADVFRREWPELLKTAEAAGVSARGRSAFLRIVGLVGSIDNDMCGTDYTIGSDSALHRITEAVDAILSTAASHRRSFVVEVMGRNCGYLALMSALISGADSVFLPEAPPPPGWEDRLCAVLGEGRKLGKRCSLVIVAEGAIDSAGQPIHAETIKKLLEHRLGHDTRITALGHVQRGGTPSAFDRNMSSLLGVAAVDAIFRIGNESVMIGWSDNRVTTSPLMECVAVTKQVPEALASKDFAKARQLRGPSFIHAWEVYQVLASNPSSSPSLPSDSLPRPTPSKPLRIVLLNAGAASPGMNTAMRVLVRMALFRGHTVYGVHNGWSGLAKGDLAAMDWMSVNGWAVSGGTFLGANRKAVDEAAVPSIAEHLAKQQIDALVMIGGLEGYVGVTLLQKWAEKFPIFRMPMICVPASISNALPATEYSIGCDTSLNNIVWAVDRIKQSAISSQRVFVIEVMGSYSGYLALMSGLAGGAERLYLHEEGVRLADLQADIAMIKKRFNSKRKNICLFVRNENANPSYTTEVIMKLFDEESDDQYDVRHCILGHIQQGGVPSPLDRINATLLSAPIVTQLEALCSRDAPNKLCAGLIREKVVFTPMDSAMTDFDLKLRRPKHQFWLELKPSADILARSEPSHVSTEKTLQRAWTAARFGLN